MKAIAYTQYGPPERLQLIDVEVPVPKARQVVIKVHAASINAADWRRFSMSPWLGRLFNGGLFKPKEWALGADVAGTVEVVGSQVTELQPGDPVFGVAPGAFAEYVCNGVSKFALKPANVSFDAAAAAPVAAFTALQGLRDKGQIQSGQRVLIYGASGGVGTMAVQIAKSFGAEVTAVCRTRNLEMARALGADHVIDYTRQNFAQNGRQYDLIFAANGNHSMFAYRRALSPRGICVVAGGSLSQILQSMLVGPVLSRRGGKKIGFMGIAATPQADLFIIRDLLAAGKLNPVIDKRFPLSETASAMRYVLDEHARGKVVITTA